MTIEQIKLTVERERRLHLRVVRVFFKDGSVHTGGVKRLTDTGFTLEGHGRVEWAEVEAAENGSFA